MAGTGDGIKMITDEAKLKYIKGGGNHCPYCESGDIESGPIDYGNLLSAIVTCGRCHKTWIDFYQITSIEECDPDDS
jgi:transposase-like protein